MVKLEPMSLKSSQEKRSTIKSFGALISLKKDMPMKETEKKKEYRKFEADILGISSFNLVLADIPSPDPAKKDFRKNQMMDERKVLFKDTDFVQRLIERLALQENSCP